MNDYSFDYLNYITGLKESPNYNINIPYQINIPNNNQINLTKTNMDQPIDPKTGLQRGNLFANLYDPYKNFKPKELNPNNEKEALLYQLMQYKFALTELNLYLDTNPNDKKMLELYNRYLTIEKQMCNQYENMFGPLTTDSPNIANNSWNWNNTPWPWEGK